MSVAEDDDADLEYLFLQVGVGALTVSDRQNCGNLLAGVAPFAVERGLIEAADGRATLRIRMVNTGSIATATFTVAGGVPVYSGGTSIMAAGRGSHRPTCIRALAMVRRDRAQGSHDNHRIFPQA